MQVVKHVQLFYSSLCYKDSSSDWIVLWEAGDEMNGAPVGRVTTREAELISVAARASQEELLIKTKLSLRDTSPSFGLQLRRSVPVLSRCFAFFVSVSSKVSIFIFSISPSVLIVVYQRGDTLTRQCWLLTVSTMVGLYNLAI